MVTKSFKGQLPRGGAVSSSVVGDHSHSMSQDIMPQPVAVSILLRAGAGSANMNNHNPSFLSNAHAQGAAALPHSTTQANKSGSQPFAVAAGVNSGSASHQVNHSQAATGPTKRTKKIAKPKTKLARARKLPTKGNRVKNKPSSSKKPASVKRGGKSTAKISGKRPAKPSHSAGEPATKRSKKNSKSEDLAIASIVETKNLGGKLLSKQKETYPTREKQQAVKIQIPSTSQIEQIVSGVVDVVTDEINHCASLFATRKWPKVVISSEDDLPDKKTSSERSHLSKESNTKKDNEGCAQAISFSKSNCTKNGVGYTVSISEEGTIHATKDSAHLTRPHRASAQVHREDKSTSEGHSPQQDGSAESDLCNVNTVAMAVRRFALEVYCPFLLSAKKSMGNDSPDNDRIRLSTLLAIREMLTMNAEKLFTFSSRNASSISAREMIYLSHIFASAIVRNAAKRLHHSRQPAGHFFVDFVQATHNYDSRSDDFQLSLERSDVRSVRVCPKNERVGQEQSMLAKVSFNFARAKHPLLHSRSYTSKDGRNDVLGNERSAGLRTQPVASACAMFHIETATGSEASTSDEAKAKEDTAILKSLAKVLRGKQKPSRK